MVATTGEVAVAAMTGVAGTATEAAGVLLLLA